MGVNSPILPSRMELEALLSHRSQVTLPASTIARILPWLGPPESCTTLKPGFLVSKGLP